MERTLTSKSGKKLPGANIVQKAPKWTRFFGSEILCVSEILRSHCNSASYGHSCFKSPGRTMEGTKRQAKVGRVHRDLILGSASASLWPGLGTLSKSLFLFSLLLLLILPKKYIIFIVPTLQF